MRRDPSTLELLDDVSIGLREVLDTLPLAVFWKDADGVYQGCNASYARLAGTSGRSDVIGRTDRDLGWRPDEADHLARLDARVLETGEALLDELIPVLDPEGRPRWLEMGRVPLRDADGQVVGLLATCTVVTQRYEERREIEASEARLRSVFDNHPGGLVLVDRDGMVLDADDRSDITGQSVLDFVSGDDREHLIGLLAQVFRSQEQVEFEMRLGDDVPALGGRWFRASIGPVLLGGEVVAATVVAHDITAERELARRVAADRRLLEAITSEIDGGVFALDAAGRFLYAFGNSVARVGLQPGQLEGIHILDVYGDLAGLRQALDRAMAGERSSYDTQLQGMTFHTVFLPVSDESGRLERIDGFALIIG